MIGFIDLDAIPETNKDRLTCEIIAGLTALPEADQTELWEIMEGLFEPGEIEEFRRMKN